MPPCSLVKKRVALLAHGQVDDVDRHQGFQRGGGVVADTSRSWPMCETSNSAAGSRQ
jgi:hypothetical protein